MSAFSFHDTKSGREFRFEGDLLGHASSGRPGRPRWSEMSLFKTRNGQYVLVKAGKSILYHATRECSRSGSHFVESRRVHGDDRRSGIPCLRCGPGPYDDIVYEENDLVTVVIGRTAEGIVESAHSIDDDQVVFLPFIARRCIEEAARKDPDIKAAYAVEVVA